MSEQWKMVAHVGELKAEIADLRTTLAAAEQRAEAAETGRTFALRHAEVRRQQAEAAESQLNTCLDALANAAFGWPNDDTRRTYNPDEVQQRAAEALRVVAAIEALTGIAGFGVDIAKPRRYQVTRDGGRPVYADSLAAALEAALAADS